MVKAGHRPALRRQRPLLRTMSRYTRAELTQIKCCRGWTVAKEPADTDPCTISRSAFIFGQKRRTQYLNGCQPNSCANIHAPLNPCDIRSHIQPPKAHGTADRCLAGGHAGGAAVAGAS